MDAIRYAVMGAWNRIKHWIPLDPDDGIKIENPLSREVIEDEHI